MRKKKATYGNGSIYQRADGMWAAKYKPTPYSKTKYLYAKTERGVRQKLNDLKNAPETLITTSPKDILLIDYITIWFRTYKRPKIKQSTFDRLDAVIRNQITPKFKYRLLKDISSDEFQQFINDLVESGLSYSVVKKSYDILNSCLKHATLKGDIPKNPMELVQGPSPSGFESKQVRALTAEEEKAILQELETKWTTGNLRYPYKDAFIIMLNTGLREGELVALDWDDIDFESKTIKVHKTTVMIKDRLPDGRLSGRCHQEVQYTPKTKSGNRDVPINNHALAALERLHEANSGSQYVLSTENKNRPVVNVLYKQLKRAADRCGIYGISPHTLRHTFATRLFEKGANVKDVSVILGHSNVNITYNTYIHVIRERKDDVVALLN